MTQAEKKENFLNSYRDTYGNLTESLKVSGTKSSDYIRFMEMPDFKKEVEAVQQIQDDLINSKFLSLVDAGDVRAVIKAKELLAVRKEGVNIDEMKISTMVYLIKHAETKKEILISFCEWFKVAESNGEAFYKKIIIEHDLKNKTPFERSNRKKDAIESSLSERFKKGDLPRIDMFKILLQESLHTAQTAFHPSERATATKVSMDIEKRIEEITDKERAENTFTNEEWVDVIDAIVLDSDVNSVQELKKKLSMIEG